METRTYAKLIDGQLITTCAPDDEPNLIEQIKADGFKLYDEDAGQPKVGKFQVLYPVYHEEKDRITLWWEVISDDPESILMEITRLEEQIAASDYKVIKSYEYALAGVKSAYDMTAIHAERESLREEIRELERLIPAKDAPPAIIEKPSEDIGAIRKPVERDDGELAAIPR